MEITRQAIPPKAAVFQEILVRQVGEQVGQLRFEWAAFKSVRNLSGLEKFFGNFGRPQVHRFPKRLHIFAVQQLFQCHVPLTVVKGDLIPGKAPRVRVSGLSGIEGRKFLGAI